MDIIFYEVFEEEERELRRFLPEGIKAEMTSATIQEHGGKDLRCRLISIRTQSIIPKEWANGLKGVLSRTTGYDHLIKYREETKTKALLGYLPDYCTRAVAEQAVLMMMTLERKMNTQIKQFDNFNRDGLTGNESLGKNLLVVGVGRIGSEIVKIAKGLEMNVRGVDIEKRLTDLEYVSLSQGVLWADIVVCALSLTERTRGLLSYELFKDINKNITFINVARGEISPIKDVVRLVDEGHFKALGLDVYENESDIAEELRSSKGADSSMVKIIKELKIKENVLFTPHNAFNTHESIERKSKRSAEEVELFLKENTFRDII